MGDQFGCDLFLGHDGPGIDLDIVVMAGVKRNRMAAAARLSGVRSSPEYPDFQRAEALACLFLFFSIFARLHGRRANRQPPRQRSRYRREALLPPVAACRARTQPKSPGRRADYRVRPDPRST